MWFDSWNDLVRIVAVGSAGYVYLVLLLRISGKRTLAKLNAFDLVVTVALGSTLASILLDKAVSWADGATGLLVLVLLQLLAALLTSRSTAARRMLTSGPSVLLRDGVPRPEEMRRRRVSMDEVRQAVRSSGSGDLGGIAAVVLETDGTISVIPASAAGDLSALAGVDRRPGSS